MRKYFLELFAIGLVDSEGRINTEHMTSDALMTSMKTMEELTKMKMDRLVLETTMEMILCMFESCDTEEFTEILGKTSCPMLQEELIIFPIRKDRNISMRPTRQKEQRRSFGRILPEKLSWILRQAEQPENVLKGVNLLLHFRSVL